MRSQTALLLLVSISSVLLSKVPRPGSDECYFVVNVPGKRMVSFGNINWPEKYNSGEICQWIFHCPGETTCRLRCPDVGLPKTDDCYMDKLLVYSKGSPNVATTKKPLQVSRRDETRRSSHSRHRTEEHLPDHPRMYCGRTTINVRSNATKIAMVLISNEASPGGRFRCTVTPEKVHRKWKLRAITIMRTIRTTTTTTTTTPRPIMVINTDRYDASY